MKDQEYDYFYDDEADAKYCYSGTNVLKNKLDIYTWAGKIRTVDMEMF